MQNINMLMPKVPRLPIIGHSIPFQINALQFTSEKQKKYGDVFEISLLNEKFIVMLTPESTKEIFLDKDDNFSSKEGWAVVLGKPFENGLMLRDFEDHKYHRSLLQGGLRFLPLSCKCRLLRAVYYCYTYFRGKCIWDFGCFKRLVRF